MSLHCGADVLKPPYRPIGHSPAHTHAHTCTYMQTDTDTRTNCLLTFSVSCCSTTSSCCCACFTGGPLVGTGSALLSTSAVSSSMMRSTSALASLSMLSGCRQGMNWNEGNRVSSVHFSSAQLSTTPQPCTERETEAEIEVECPLWWRHTAHPPNRKLSYLKHLEGVLHNLVNHSRLPADVHRET